MIRLFRVGQLVLISLVLFLVSCGERKPDAASNTGDSSRAVTVDSTQQYRVDTVPPFAPPDTMDLGDTGFVDRKRLLREYIADYPNRHIEDTSFVCGGDSITVHLERYSLNDRKLRIPQEYYEEVMNKDFVTHNYALQVNIQRNGRIVFQKRLLKEDLYKASTESLKSAEHIWKYGTMISSSYSGCNDASLSILVTMDLTIPLTDVGMGIALEIDSTGHYSVHE